MLPPESSGTTGPVPPTLPREERRDADGARAFDDELRPLEQQHDRLA